MRWLQISGGPIHRWVGRWNNCTGAGMGYSHVTSASLRRRGLPWKSWWKAKTFCILTFRVISKRSLWIGIGSATSRQLGSFLFGSLNERRERERWRWDQSRTDLILESGNHLQVDWAQCEVAWLVFQEEMVWILSDPKMVVHIFLILRKLNSFTLCASLLSFLKLLNLCLSFFTVQGRFHLNDSKLWC